MSHHTIARRGAIAAAFVAITFTAACGTDSSGLQAPPNDVGSVVNPRNHDEYGGKTREVEEGVSIPRNRDEYGGKTKEVEEGVGQSAPAHVHPGRPIL